VFIIDSTRGRQLRIGIAAGLVACVAALVSMDLAQGDYPGPSVPASGGGVTPSAVYWVIVCAAHLVTDIVVVIVCGQNSRLSKDRDLVWALRLFAAGSVLAIAYWGLYLAYVYVRMPHALVHLALIIDLHGVSRALTLLVPVVTGAARRARDLRLVWVLWPVWRDLTVAVPNVTLVAPRASRFREIVRPRAPVAVQAHRQIIEIYDAVLDLQTHTTPGVYELALDHARRTGVPAHRTEAAALAGALGHARRTKLEGAPATAPQVLPGLDRADAALLLEIARHWPVMSTALPTQELVAT
jgi:hypothetical protein